MQRYAEALRAGQHDPFHERAGVLLAGDAGGQDAAESESVTFATFEAVRLRFAGKNVLVHGQVQVRGGFTTNGVGGRANEGIGVQLRIQAARACQGMVVEINGRSSQTVTSNRLDQRVAR